MHPKYLGLDPLTKVARSSNMDLGCDFGVFWIQCFFRLGWNYRKFFALRAKNSLKIPALRAVKCFKKSWFYRKISNAYRPGGVGSSACSAIFFRFESLSAVFSILESEKHPHNWKISEKNVVPQKKNIVWEKTVEALKQQKMWNTFFCSFEP